MALAVLVNARLIEQTPGATSVATTTWVLAEDVRAALLLDACEAAGSE